MIKKWLSLENHVKIYTVVIVATIECNYTKSLKGEISNA